MSNKPKRSSCKRNKKVDGDKSMRQPKVTDTMKKTRRVHDRFNGTSKEELLKRILPDHIEDNLDILIIGINPGLFAAYKGHHYVGPGNHFWKCLYMSGLIPEPLTGMQDFKALNYKIGFTNMVARTTPGSKDLSSKEIREGSNLLVKKIQTYHPKIAVFNGKCIYEIFSKEVFGQKKKDFKFGHQTNYIPETSTAIFVMPSTSARCAQFPRAEDKVHYFIQLKKLRDEINGLKVDDDVVETNYTFDLQQATKLAKINQIKEEKQDIEYEVNNNNDSNLRTPFPHETTTKSSKELSASCVEKSPDTNHCSQSKPQNTNTHSKTSPQNNNEPSAENHPNLMQVLQAEDNLTPTLTGLMTKATCSHNFLSSCESFQNNRVKSWVETQRNQTYDHCELPMGYESRFNANNNIRIILPEPDAISQQSMFSAGVSGSTSGSTSGYYSIDGNVIQYSRQDRVERWILDQQYVQNQLPERNLQTIQN